MEYFLLMWDAPAGVECSGMPLLTRWDAPADLGCCGMLLLAKAVSMRTSLWVFMSRLVINRCGHLQRVQVLIYWLN